MEGEKQHSKASMNSSQENTASSYTSSDKDLKTSTPIEDKNERFFTLDQFNEAINYAHVLQQADLTKNKNFPGGLESAICGTDPQHIPLSVVQSTVRDLMPTGQPYMQKAMDLLFPSTEQMNKDLETQNAVPSLEVIANRYKTKIERELRLNLPESNIHIDMYYYANYGISPSFKFEISKVNKTEETKKSFLGWLRRKLKTRKQIHELAEIIIEYHDPGYKIKNTLYDPLFLRVASEKIKELDQWFVNSVQPRKVSFEKTYQYQTD